MTSHCNVLISSAGRRVALLRGFRSALRDLGLDGRVMATDRTPLASAFQDADDRFLVPSVDTPDFVPALLEICERERVDVVVPTIDPELPVYAAHREAFAAIGTYVAVSSPEVVAIGSDKRETNRWLRDAGLPHVWQAPIADAVLTLQDLPFPLVAKPRFGSASVGVSVVDDAASLESLAARAGPDVLVEAKAPGVEHTTDVLIDRDGQLVCAVPRRRLEVRAGEVSKGVTVRSEALLDLAASVVASLPGARGVLNFQTFVSADELAIIELNARFGGGFPLSLAAGANFPRWLLEDVVGLDSTASPSSWLDDLVMLRFDDAVFRSGAEIGEAP